MAKLVLSILREASLHSKVLLVVQQYYIFCETFQCHPTTRMCNSCSSSGPPSQNIWITSPLFQCRCVCSTSCWQKNLEHIFILIFARLSLVRELVVSCVGPRATLLYLNIAENINREKSFFIKLGGSLTKSVQV